MRRKPKNSVLTAEEWRAVRAARRWIKSKPNDRERLMWDALRDAVLWGYAICYLRSNAKPKRANAKRKKAK